MAGVRDVQVTLRRSLDAGVSVLLARLTPRLRTALNVFEGQSSLIQYELGEAAFAAAEDGANAFVTEFLPVLSSILAPFQVRRARTHARLAGARSPLLPHSPCTAFAVLWSYVARLLELCIANRYRSLVYALY